MSIKTILLLAIMAVVAVMCVSCVMRFGKRSNQYSPHASFENLGVDDFQTLIADENVQLLDVRTRDEYDEGHIAGAALVDVNDSSFVEKAMALLDHERPVAVYCRSGRRSARAAIQLATQGLTVSNLDGGVIAWEDAGKALVK